MIVCGWCGDDTQPGRCSHCGRDSALPWTQRGSEPPLAHPERDTGRPSLDPSQIKQKLRIAKKELGDVTSAALAEHLGVSERTLNRWQKLAG